MVSVVCYVCGWCGLKLWLDCTYWICGQCCVFRMCMVESNILIGLYVLDMWSVSCVMYVGGGI